MTTRLVLIRVLTALLLAAVMIPLGATSAWASCAEPPDLETAFADADVVFIGVVVELSNNDRTAVMQVEQVWKGPELPDVVTVRGGPEEPNVATSVDRTFELGTYVVFPVNSAPPFEDNACTLTQRTTPALDVINPSLTEPPEDPDEPEPVATTIAGAPAEVPAVTTANTGDNAVPEPEVADDVSVLPWVIAAGVVVSLLIGAYALRQRRPG
ncbi:MAG: hypothetical protein ACC658_04275 [Acidimicrobiia bacterium]